MESTSATFTMSTDRSSMFTTLSWNSDGRYSTGDLFVTFTSGQTYRYEGVPFSALGPILDASDEYRSMGEALSGIIQRYHRHVSLVA